MFRYDYLRSPRSPHPAAHVQIRGQLTEQANINAEELKDIHFPTGRVSLEGVIRTLAEQFGVPCRQEPSFWRPLLAESERDFLEMAHQPLSGPER